MNPHSHPHVEPTSVAWVREGGRSLLGSCFTFGTFFRKAQASFKGLPRHSLPNQGLPETTDNPHLLHSCILQASKANVMWVTLPTTTVGLGMHPGPPGTTSAAFIQQLSRSRNSSHSFTGRKLSLAGQGLALGPFLFLQCCSERGVSSNTSLGCNTELPGALFHCKLSILHFFLPRCSFSL